MVIENTSTSQLIMLNLLGEGRNLILKPKGKSDPIIPNKKMLSVLINKSDKIRLIVSDHMEVELLSQLDPRAADIVVFEGTNKEKSEATIEED